MVCAPLANGGDLCRSPRPSGEGNPPPVEGLGHWPYDPGALRAAFPRGVDGARNIPGGGAGPPEGRVVRESAPYFLIHAAGDFAALFLRGLWSNDNTFWRMVWK